MIGDGVDRPLVALQHLDMDRDMVGQQRAAPAAGAEGADRRQRQERRVDRHDRPVRRQVVGGRAGRRGDQNAVADQFLKPHLAVDRQAQLGGLIGLPQK